MQLEQYFKFLPEDAILVAGTRVGIETIVEEYNQGASPEEIVIGYPTLSLEQVHATITYYLGHRAKIDAYVARTQADQERAWEDQQRNPSAFVQTLRTRLEEHRQTRRDAIAAPSLATSATK
jgi:uncharacterized protein (DUF433 family)